MKKTFPLHAPGKDDARVLDAIKHDVRKYVKRERNKPLPEGFDRWNFECRVGVDQTAAQTKTLQEISGALAEIAQTGRADVYVEIHAVPGQRTLPSADTGSPDKP